MKSFTRITITAALFLFSCLGLACGGPTTTSDVTAISKEEAQAFATADWPFDFCEEFGWYGDGICDWYCPLPDPDCQCRISEECFEDEYCNSVFQDPPNPPEYGECLAMGDCLNVADCDHPDNQWMRPLCIGDVVCIDGHCSVECDPGPLFCDSTSDCPEDHYCAPSIYLEFNECLPQGECNNVMDCHNPENEWIHPACMGYPTCEEGLCGWVCDELPLLCHASGDCLPGQYCSIDPMSNMGMCLDMGECQNDLDCYNDDNDWGYPSGWGIEFACVEGQCEFRFDEDTCAAQGGTCMSDPVDVTYPADCEELGLVTVAGICPAVNLSCCKSVMPPACEDVGGICISGIEPPPPSLCSDRGLSASYEGVCRGFDEICCEPAICSGLIGVLCQEGFECIDIPDSCDPANGGADCPGFCVEDGYHECGGFLGLMCPEGRACLDIPGDGCDPREGGADCGGYCVPY